jgi:hypothetical protein
VAGAVLLQPVQLVPGRAVQIAQLLRGKPDFREVTVFEMEVLEALARNDPPVQSGPIKIAPTDRRRSGLYALGWSWSRRWLRSRPLCLYRPVSAFRLGWLS